MQELSSRSLPQKQMSNFEGGKQMIKKSPNGESSRNKPGFCEQIMNKITGKSRTEANNDGAKREWSNMDKND